MDSFPVCERCGESIPPEEPDCPFCSGRKRYPFLHREPILIVAVIALAIGLWIVTHGVTAAYERRQEQLAVQWSERGVAELRQSQWRLAIAHLRTALAYAHDNSTVRLRLAQALAADGQVPQAQAYLRALWEEQPGDGTINLELARLAARTGNLPDAQRYYHGAIYGVWANSPIERRRNARLELIDFLLLRRSFAQAESELIAVSAELPRDNTLRLRVARMFLQAGDPARALTEFRAVAQAEPRSAVAYAGAGEAAFRQQDYRAARYYLDRAVALNSNDAASAQLARTAELVLNFDPFVARIGHEERTRRVLRSVEQAQYRLEKCAEQVHIDLKVQPATGPVAADYAQVLALKPRMTASVLRRDPDLADSAMDLVFRSEEDAASVCGSAEGADAALLLVGRLYQSARAPGGGR